MDETMNTMDEIERVVGEVVSSDDGDTSSVSEGIQTIIVDAGSADGDITKLAVIVGTAAGIGAAAVCGGLVWAGKKLISFGKDKIEAGKQKRSDKKSKKQDADEADTEDNTSEDDNESDEVSEKKTSKRK